MKMNVLNRKVLLYGILLIFSVCLVLQSCRTSPDEEPAPMVILIGIDGMSNPGLQRASTPNIDELIRQGATSLSTRAVMPTISGPNWASHLLGAGPVQHGVTMNGWTPATTILTPTETDEQGFFPSVFSVIRDQDPGAVTGFVYDWKDLGYIFDTEKISKVAYTGSHHESIEVITPWIIEQQPDFTFIYMGYPDEVGHEYKWESEEFIRSLGEVDGVLGILFDVLKEAGLFDQTIFIVASDHGGIDYGHGGVSMEEVVIPWIISGPGTIRDKLIEQPNDVFNTASTIIHLLGLEQPYSWIGRPVSGAFSDDPMSEANQRSYVPRPFSNIQDKISSKADTLAFFVEQEDLTIRYTLNAEQPGKESAPYTGPLILTDDSKVKAAAFDGDNMSEVVAVKTIRVQPVEHIALKYPPKPQYAAEGPATLINRQLASNDFMDGKWLGFEGDDLVATIRLGKTAHVDAVTIGYLHTPGSWIFQPKGVTIMGSADGNAFFTLAGLDEQQIAETRSGGRNELTIPVNGGQLKYVKIRAVNTAVCPPGHPGEGQPAWLFIDEIMVR